MNEWDIGNEHQSNWNIHKVFISPIVISFKDCPARAIFLLLSISHVVVVVIVVGVGDGFFAGFLFFYSHVIVCIHRYELIWYDEHWRWDCVHLLWTEWSGTDQMKNKDRGYVLWFLFFLYAWIPLLLSLSLFLGFVYMCGMANIFFLLMIFGNSAHKASKHSNTTHTQLFISLNTCVLQYFNVLTACLMILNAWQRMEKS